VSAIEDLFDEAEREGRERAVSLEALGKLPHGFVDKHYPLTRRELRELRRLKAAGYAATDVDTFVALCKGRPVPASRLNSRLISYQHRIHDGS
jgi:hypothetical protein